MRNANHRLLYLLSALSALAMFVPAIPGQEHGKVDPRQYLAELARVGARKPFLVDSPDVYLEPRSLNRFFTEPIYRRLQGNAYFGYDFDEGFRFEGKAVQIEALMDVTPGSTCYTAYKLALERALGASGLEVRPAATCQIGVCIVGVETRETEKTLPGVMVEAYLRNVQQKKSFFIRFGAGNPRGVAAAIWLSAEMLVSQLESRWRSDERAGTR
ncbi:MAG TPA: hypothetical protein VE398_11190 [Acidobacteriota bacterium]|nr:hypothetical protein [Acidobacteriota bacterium]